MCCNLLVLSNQQFKTQIYKIYKDIKAKAANTNTNNRMFIMTDLMINQLSFQLQL